MQRVALHRRAGDDPGPSDAQPLFGPPGPVGRDAGELLVLQHGVVVGFGEQRSAEPLLQLARLGALELGPGAAQVGELLGAEQVVARLERGVDRFGLVPSGADVEELGGVLGGVDRGRERRQHEHRERGPPAPFGVVHLAERPHVVGIEPSRSGDGLLEA